MKSIIIGNMISFCAMLCLVTSCYARDRDRMYRFQLFETVLCTIASLFFGSYSGLSTQFIAIYRNWRVYKKRYTFWDMIVSAILIVVIGLWVNNRGWIGLIPIVATIELTLLNFYLKNENAIHISIMVNTMLWMVYSFAIFDFASVLGQVLSISAGLISSYRGWKKARAAVKFG